MECLTPIYMDCPPRKTRVSMSCVLYPVAELGVKLPSAGMRHADAVADRLVLDLYLVVGRIDGARRTCRIREADGDADGTRDAGGEVRPVEIRCPLFGGGATGGR